MRVLVTGASGFIGQHLVNRLTLGGHDVVATDQRVDAGVGVLSVTGDFQRIVDTMFGVEVVFHLAGQGDVGASFVDPVWDAQVNLVGTMNVWQAANQAGVRKIVFPATWLIGDAASPYAASKLAAAHALRALARRSKPDVAVLVLGNVYGPGGDNVVTTLMERVLAGESCTVAPEAMRDFVHVSDVCDAMVLAGQTDGSHWLHIGSGEATSLEDLAGMIVAAAGKPAEVHRGEPDPGGFALDPAPARAELGWEPKIEMKDGLAGMVATAVLP